ncbi:hypothetical protein JCM10908_006366 [Rhodotorula pacifica]|uniref:uncharacterized protein n=1 Tax=Rhodotorula pacifica TaxID=1495444 RepID=UPI00316E0F98
MVETRRRRSGRLSRGSSAPDAEHAPAAPPAPRVEDTSTVTTSPPPKKRARTSAATTSGTLALSHSDEPAGAVPAPAEAVEQTSSKFSREGERTDPSTAAAAQEAVTSSRTPKKRKVPRRGVSASLDKVGEPIAESANAADVNAVERGPPPISTVSPACDAIATEKSPTEVAVETDHEIAPVKPPSSPREPCDDGVTADPASDVQFTPSHRSRQGHLAAEMDVAAGSITPATNTVAGPSVLEASPRAVAGLASDAVSGGVQSQTNAAGIAAGMKVASGELAETASPKPGRSPAIKSTALKPNAAQNPLNKIRSSKVAPGTPKQSLGGPKSVNSSGAFDILKVLQSKPPSSIRRDDEQPVAPRTVSSTTMITQAVKEAEARSMAKARECERADRLAADVCRSSSFQLPDLVTLS